MDAHLHCFSFPDLDMEIMPEEGGGNGGWYTDENDIQADIFLEKCKWIRYTYDFGDEWCHKIVLEKKDPAYQLRHAVLLKAEGKNFEEDSGGVLWCGDDRRIAFRAAAVGKRLNALELPVMKEEEAVSREAQHCGSFSWQSRLNRRSSSVSLHRKGRKDCLLP